MTKDTLWQRFNGAMGVGVVPTQKRGLGPALGALLFCALLGGMAVWFSGGATGPILAMLGLMLALVVSVFGNAKTRDLLIAIFLGVSGLALAIFSGGFTTAAACAILWPIFASGALGSRISFGIGASICAFATLILLSELVNLPDTTTLASQSGVLALGVNGALALAACVAMKSRQTLANAPVNEQLSAATKSRDEALAEVKVARAQTKGRAQFMAEMSHEIRTPLNAILGFADTMREGVFGPLPAAYGDYPDLIHTSGTHLLDLVSDLLDLSKIEAGRYETNLKPIRLDELAYEGVRLSSGAARAAGVQIRHEASSAISVLGDARALRQIVFNLMSNAIKFTPKGGRVSLRVLVEPDTRTASIEVEDTGVGISETELLQIGQPWNQGREASPSDTQKTRGSGLGLALVKRLTDLQGGTFSISSTLGVGTRARVSFPIAIDEDTITPPATS